MGPMRAFIVATIIASLSVTLGLIDDASACGPSPPAYWTLTGILPSADPIPRDGAVLVTGKAWTDVYPERESGEFSQAVTITVRDHEGNAVPGEAEPWWLGRVSAALWRSRQALPANQTFTLTASVTEPIERPSNATGETTLQTSLAVGDQLAPPMRLTEGLRVTMETYDHELFKDCNGCGTGCTPNGSVRSLRARIVIPAATGGYTPDPDGYRAWLWLSNDRPHDLPDGRGGTTVNLGGIEIVPVDRAVEVVRPIPTEDEPYAPCFSMRVFDPAGHFVDAPPLCLPTLDVAAKIKELDAEPAGGCAVSRPQVRVDSRAAPAIFALVWAVVAGLGRRRRFARSRSGT